jgi:UDP-N-acetylglucosamine--N-acetylmuramyl-(pentapeptide) pyrophosphoryl-undecaprenol N-acetylglucosamine transferase
MERFFPKAKIVFTGNPVRENLVQNMANKAEALQFYGLNANERVVLVTGGSLGARSLNNAMLKNLEIIAKSGVQVIWQTGAIYFDQISNELKDNKPENLHVYQFLSRMDLAYAAADLVISRAGASTISELCIVGKPAVLIPSPNVAEDHQTKNAMALVEKEAAIMLTDNEIDLKLFPVTLRLVKDEERCNIMATNIKSLAMPDATKAIVDEVEKLIK